MSYYVPHLFDEGDSLVSYVDEMHGGIVWGGVFDDPGGIVWGGFPLRKRRRITIPAGTTSEDLYSFTVFVYHKDLEGEDNVQFEDANYNPLPFGFRADGTYTVHLDTITSAQDTIFYVYYGEE
ncbi:hypothetical protein [Anatilimnocola floriformis]|uniref:hypothetical protein n=1 Tax=Anatilimnocola floriformis TaxID=2948575 RepID=UPI0020C2E558|nr:hypothetical protein [Anatilimnocola floriformis]